MVKSQRNIFKVKEKRIERNKGIVIIHVENISPKEINRKSELSDLKWVNPRFSKRITQ